MKQTIKLLALPLLVAAGLFLFSAPKAHAATFTVASGDDETVTNSSCSLSEAIGNINDQATTNTDCSPSGAYGTDDTINLPAGTITLTANLPGVTQSVSIQGQGMGKSIINGDNGQYYAVQVNGSIDSLELRDLTIAGFKGAAVVAQYNVPADVLRFSATRLEIDGSSAAVGDGALVGFGMFLAGGATHTADFDNVYIHDMTGDAAGTLAGMMLGSIDNTLQVRVDNTTISSLHNTNASAGTQGINFMVGPFSGFHGGTLNATVTNTTINDFSALHAAANGIAGVSMVNGEDANMTLAIRNTTIAGARGTVMPGYSLGSSAFGFAGVAFTDTDNVNFTAEVANVLLADNKNDAAPNNCGIANLNSSFGGAGTVNLVSQSSGGNLSDDTSCTSYFTQSTDHNNLTSLSSTLGALGYNGGYVPTIPLLAGSPAIDSGVTVTGLTTDARGVARPQGTSYDSGAYEYVKPIVATLADTGQNVVVVMVAATGLIFSAALVFIQRRSSVLQ